jgi:hypothetical protein
MTSKTGSLDLPELLFIMVSVRILGFDPPRTSGVPT